MAKKKESKKRAEKYEPKLAIKGTFENAIKVIVKDPQKK